MIWNVEGGFSPTGFSSKWLISPGSRAAVTSTGFGPSAEGEPAPFAPPTEKIFSLPRVFRGPSSFPFAFGFWCQQPRILYGIYIYMDCREEFFLGVRQCLTSHPCLPINSFFSFLCIFPTSQMSFLSSISFSLSVSQTTFNYNSGFTFHRLPEAVEGFKRSWLLESTEINWNKKACKRSAPGVAGILMI